MRVQAVNDVGALVSLFSFLTAAVLLAAIAVRLLRGRRPRRLAVALRACVLAHAAALLSVSFFSEAQTLSPGTDKCFDDWCVTVERAQRLPPAPRDRLAIGLRVNNRARRAAFRPSQPRATLLLADGAALTGVEQGPELSTALQAGASLETTLVFELPAGAQPTSLLILEGPALLSRLLIGDEASFFHRKTVFRLDPAG